MNKEVGPHNLYNMMDFCPSVELELEQWNAALRPNADGHTWIALDRFPRRFMRDATNHHVSKCLSPPPPPPPPPLVLLAFSSVRQLLGCGHVAPPGTLPRMDEPRHQASLRAAAAGPAVGADPELPLGSRQRWCGVDSAMNLWLGVEAVKVALHVDKPKGTEVNNLAYHKAGADDLTELYRTLAKK